MLNVMFNVHSHIYLTLKQARDKIQIQDKQSNEEERENIKSGSFYPTTSISHYTQSNKKYTYFRCRIIDE